MPTAAAPTAGGAARSSSERRWAWLFLAPMLVGLALLSAGPILATLAISFTDWDLLTPARCGRTRQLPRPSWPTTALLAGAAEHHLLHGALRAPGHGPRAAPGHGPQPGHPGHRLDPDDVLPAAGHLDGRGRPGVALDLLAPGRWPAQRVPVGLRGIPPQRWMSDPFWAMPAIIVMSVWQGLGVNIIIFLAGLQAIPQEYHDAASVDGAGRWARFRHVTLPLLTPEHLLHRHPGPHRRPPGLRPGLRPGAPGQAHRSHHHARLLHLRRRLPLLPDGLARVPRPGSCSSSRRSSPSSTSGPAPLGALPVSAWPRVRPAPPRCARLGGSTPSSSRAAWS